MDTIAKEHSYRTLLASGTAVGLSEGLMGNSEVGYVLINFQLGFLGIAFGFALSSALDFYISTFFFFWKIDLHSLPTCLTTWILMTFIPGI